MDQKKEQEIIRDPGEITEDDRAPGPEFKLTREERRWYALGATMSGLLIGMVYIIGFAIVIGLMLWFWG